MLEFSSLLLSNGFREVPPAFEQLIIHSYFILCINEVFPEMLCISNQPMVGPLRAGHLYLMECRVNSSRSRTLPHKHSPQMARGVKRALIAGLNSTNSCCGWWKVELKRPPPPLAFTGSVLFPTQPIIIVSLMPIPRGPSRHTIIINIIIKWRSHAIPEITIER